MQSKLIKRISQEWSQGIEIGHYKALSCALATFEDTTPSKFTLFVTHVSNQGNACVFVVRVTVKGVLLLDTVCPKVDVNSSGLRGLCVHATHLYVSSSTNGGGIFNYISTTAPG